MVLSSSPVALLPVLANYATKHKNPKVRAKAAFVLSRAVAQAAALPEAPGAAWIEAALRAAGFMIQDNGQEARDAAKAVCPILKRLQGDLAGASSDPAEAPGAAGGGAAGWDAYVTGVLGAGGALAILKL